MKKIGKFAAVGLLVALGATAMTSCGENNSFANEVLERVIISQDGEHVTADFDLPKTVKHGEEYYNLTWTSSDTSVLDIINDEAKPSFQADVKRPFDVNKDVKLTVTVEVDGKQASNSFKTTVDKIDINDAIQAAVRSLGIGSAYNAEDFDAAQVINLPTSSKEYQDEITFAYSLVGTPATVKLEGTKLTIDPTTNTKEKAQIKVTATSGSTTKDVLVDISVNVPTDITSKVTIADGKVSIPFGAIPADGKYSISLGENTEVVIEWIGYAETANYKEFGFGKTGSDHALFTVNGDAYVIHSLFSDVYGTYDNMKTYQGTDATGTAISAVKGSGDKGTGYTYEFENAKNVYFVNTSTHNVQFYGLQFTYGAPKTITKYSITYVSEHGTAPAKVEEATKLPDPVGPVLTDDNFNFKGWYTTPTFEEGTEAAAGTALTADATLYAKWEAKPTEPVVVNGFTGVVTAVGYKSPKDNAVRCYALVQNAEGQAKFVYVEAPVTSTNTEAQIKATFGAKFVVGKTVTVDGTVNDYNGLSQWVVAWADLETKVALGEAGTIPAVTDITSKVGNTTELKELQGILVKVTGTYNAQAGTLEVEGGKSILVYFENGFLATSPLTGLKNGGKYTVSGYLNWFNQPQISPLDANAVTIVDESGVNTSRPTTPEATVTGTSITTADLGFANQTLVTYLQFTDGNLYFEKGSGVTQPTYYTSGAAIRLYKGNVMTFTSEKKIVKIEFTTGTYNDAKLEEDNTTVNVGSMDWTTLTWTGEANEVVFTVDSSTSDKPRIVTIKVTYAE